MKNKILTYTINFTCQNCGITRRLEINKGITIKEYLNTASCSQCDCKTLERNHTSHIQGVELPSHKRWNPPHGNSSNRPIS